MRSCASKLGTRSRIDQACPAHLGVGAENLRFLARLHVLRVRACFNSYVALLGRNYFRTPGGRGLNRVGPRRPVSAAPSFRRHLPGDFASQHSQMRTTIQPSARRSFVIRRSRARLPSIFLRHSTAFVAGEMFLPQSWPCQKQPSTNTSTRSLRQQKSGVPSSR